MPSMKFHVSRQACCAQDDQIGPLELVYELGAEATLQDLTEAVIRSGFLQFTSTHSVMVGEVGNDALVRVSDAHFGHAQGPQYLRAADILVRNLIGPGELHFRFEFDSKLNPANSGPSYLRPNALSARNLKNPMGVPNMSKERYYSLAKGQRFASWAAVALACALVGYFLFAY